MLVGSTNGANAGQMPCAVSKKMSLPTLPMPLISCMRVRTFLGEEFTPLRRLLRSPSRSEWNVSPDHPRRKVRKQISSLFSSCLYCSTNRPYFCRTNIASSPKRRSRFLSISRVASLCQDFGSLFPSALLKGI